MRIEFAHTLILRRVSVRIEFAVGLTEILEIMRLGRMLHYFAIQATDIFLVYGFVAKNEAADWIYVRPFH